MHWEYQCPNGHLVVGTAPIMCPQCHTEDEANERWRHDPYLIYATDMAYARGLLRGSNLSHVQVALLSARLVRDAQDEVRRADDKFERQMLIGNPTLYDAYMKRKQEVEAEESEGLTWRLPSGPQEVQEIMAEIARAQARAGINESEPIPEQEWGPWSPTLDDLEEMED